MDFSILYRSLITDSLPTLMNKAHIYAIWCDPPGGQRRSEWSRGNEGTNNTTATRHSHQLNCPNFLHEDYK